MRASGTANVQTGYLRSPAIAMNCGEPRKAALAGIATAARLYSFHGSHVAAWSGSIDMGLAMLMVFS